MPAVKWMRHALALAISCVATSPAFADVEAPSVEPLPAYTAGTSVLVRGHARPHDYVFVRNEHRRVHTQADASGAFSLAVPLEADETNRLSLYSSRDAKGRHHKSEHVHLVTTSDTVAPVISAAVSPAPNAAGWHRAPATVHFTCSDRVSGVAKCPADIVIATPGANQVVTGEALDRAGNRASVSVSINLDTGAPQVRLTAPPTGAVSQPSLVLAGSVQDDLSGVSALNCNSVPAQLAGDRFTCTVTLTAGDNAIRVWALDVAGNVGETRTSVALGPRLPRGDAHQSVVSADLDGDGIADIVRTEFLIGTVAVARGRGDGTFAPEQHVPVGPNPSAVALLNAQGDLITAHYSTGEAAIHRRQPDGSYVTSARFVIGAFPAALLLADVDGNGNLDLISTHAGDGTVRIHLAQSDGTYRLQRTLPVGRLPAALAAGTIRGALAIATANFDSDDVSLLVADGKGGFAPEQRVSLGAKPGQPTPSRFGPVAIAMADVNADGLPDLLTANSLAGSVSLLTAQAAGGFVAQVLPAGASPTALATADIDGDRRVDVLFAQADGTLGWLHNTTTGFASTQTLFSASGTSLVVRDVNGDGRVDVVGVGVQGPEALLNRGPLQFLRALSAVDAMAYPHVQFLPYVGGRAATGSPAAYRSSILIRNAAAAGNRVAVTFLDVNGTTVAQAQGVIAANASARFDTIGALPAGWSGSVPVASFRGSAIVSATRPMMVVHEVSTERGVRDAHPGISQRETDTTLYLPLVRSNFLGVSSRIHVQNVGDKPTRVFIGFRPQRFGNVGRSGIASLAPGQSGEVALADLDLLDASGSFRGSAGISSTDAPIAAIVIDDALASPLAPALSVHPALGRWAASTQLQVPLYLSRADRNLVTHGSDWSTVLAITNAGTPGDPPADIQIIPGENAITSGFAATATAASPDLQPCDALNPLAARSENGLAAGETIYVELEGVRPCRFAGPVTITSSNGQPLVALVMHESASDASSLPALPSAYAASEILIPLVRSGVGGAQLYTEITARNLGSTEALVSISFSPNLIPGGGQPNDARFFVSPGGVLHYTDLQLRGIHYEGSAALRTNDGQPLAAAVSEVAVNRSATDALSSYPALAADKTLAHLKTLSLPDTLIVPLLGPCVPFAAAMTQARDTLDPNGVTIPANVLRPLLPLGPQNCFETDDEELNNQAYTYGIKVTGNLQSFFELDPQVAVGPLPFLLLSTRPQYGVFGSNDSEAAVATLRSTAKNRITAGRWGGYAAAGAAVVAAAALAAGASQLRVERLSKFDWTAGPVDLRPGAVGPKQKSAGLEHALAGDAPSDEDSPYMQNLFREIRDFMWSEATTNPTPPSDPCKNGSVDLVALNLQDHFINADMSFVKVPVSQTGILTIMHMFPKQDGFRAMCGLIRELTSCVRSQKLQHLDIVTDIRNVPSEVVDMLEKYWSASHRQLGQTTDVWSIDLQQPDESGCVDL